MDAKQAVADSSAPFKIKSCLAQALLADLPLALALIGLLAGQRWLVWVGLIGFGIYLGIGAVCGLVGGLYLPVYTVRKWKSLPPAGKLIFALSSLFVVACLGGILAAWVATR